MNMVGYVFHKKKKSEKNTQACLMNMRGSLPLLFAGPQRRESVMGNKECKEFTIQM